MKNKISMTLYGTLFIIGLAIFYFATREYLKTHRIISEGVKVESIVIDFETVKDSDGVAAYSPIYEYRDLNGTTKTFTNKIASVEPKVKIGDMEKLIYNPNVENGIKVNSYWGLYRWAIVLSIFAFPFLVIGGGYFLYLLI